MPSINIMSRRREEASTQMYQFDLAKVGGERINNPLYHTKPQRPRIAGVRTVPFWDDCGDPRSNERQASVTQRNNIGIHRFHQAKTKKAVTSPIRVTTNNGLSLGTHFRHECQKRMQHLQGLFPNWWPWTSLVFRKKPN